LGHRRCECRCSHQPIQEIQQQKIFCPKGKEFTAKITRQHLANGLPFSKIPQPNNWPKQASIAWLKAHPIMAPDDIDFIRKEIIEFERLVTDDNLESSSKEELCCADAWSGPLHYLQSYHVLIDDSIKEAYWNKDNKSQRDEIDAHLMN
jgi:hypothetical protein